MVNSFTMECILATAFGRHVNVLRGESSELSQQIEIIIGCLVDGQVEKMIVLESKDIISCHIAGKFGKHSNLVNILSLL
jgi:hypothetical protein